MPLQEMHSTKSACLIITEHSPESFSPAGERIRHMALAGRSFFRKTIVVTWSKTSRKGHPNADSEVLLYTTGVVKATPYPVSAFFDPIKCLAYIIHGMALSIRYKPDFIVASMPPIETGVAAWLLTGLLRKRLVIDLRDDWESSQEVQLKRYIPLNLLRVSHKVARRIYSLSRVILSATLTIAHTLHRRNIQVPTLVTSNGANTTLFFPRDAVSRQWMRQKWYLPLEKFVVLYCGSGGNPYYRLDMILSSSKLLPSDVKNRISFVFYLYSAIDYYKRLRDELGVPESLVQIREPLRRSDLSRIMGACDVGLVPFDDKPYLLCARSTKMYEYLSSGLFVLSSGPAGGELDSFFSKNPDLGAFVPPRPEDFAEALSKVVDSPESILGDKDRRLRHSFVRDNYDSRTIMKKAMGYVASLRDQ